MNVTLDGEALFDEQDLRIEVGSWSRTSIERTVCGLDGVLSVDLGQRSRAIRQYGTLRAVSRLALTTRINSIAAFLDGNTHTLIAADGQQYERLRIDSFNSLAEHASGFGVVVEYNIVYTQLGA